MSEGNMTLPEGNGDETSTWNKRRLRACRTDMIGATEIEKSLCGFKLGLGSRVLEKGHEFAEELAAKSWGCFILEVDVATLSLIWAAASVVALGNMGKARGLVCPWQTKSGIGDGWGTRGWIARFSRLPKDGAHGSECGALHRLQWTWAGDGLTWHWSWMRRRILGRWETGNPWGKD